MRGALVSLAILLAAVMVPGPPTPAAAAPAAVPEEFRALYARLSERLAAFDARISREWNDTKHPVAFAAGLITANPNTGEALLAPQTAELNMRYLEALQRLGVRAIAVDINFPLLAADFLGEAKRQQYLAFYRRIAAEVRRRGLGLSIEVTTVFPDFSSLPVAAYYRKLSFEQYIKARADMMVTVVTELKPDLLTIGNEPDTEAHNSGQATNVLSNAAREMSAIIAAVRGAGYAGKVGAGFGNWQQDYTAWTQAYGRLPLDFINVHIYPADGDMLDRALAITRLVRSAGKGLAAQEAWLYKWRAGERVGVAASSEVFGRDAYAFWAPLDQRFLEVFIKLAHYGKFESVSPFWSNYFFAYLDYGTARALPAQARIRQAILQGAEAAAAGRESSTGTVYKRLIAP